VIPGLSINIHQAIRDFKGFNRDFNRDLMGFNGDYLNRDIMGFTIPNN
jgi:hypothetical protein